MKELKNLGIRTMKRQYIKPRIIVVPQTYVEGVMLETISLGTGTGGATAPPDAKPGREWGYDGWDTDTWNDPNTNL